MYRYRYRPGSFYENVMGTFYPVLNPSGCPQQFDEFFARHWCMIQAKTCIVNLKNIPIGFVLRKGGFEITDCDFKSSLIQNRSSIYVPSEPVAICDHFRKGK